MNVTTQAINQLGTDSRTASLKKVPVDQQGANIPRDKLSYRSMSSRKYPQSAAPRRSLSRANSTTKSYRNNKITENAGQKKKSNV